MAPGFFSVRRVAGKESPQSHPEERVGIGKSLDSPPRSAGCYRVAFLAGLVSFLAQARPSPCRSSRTSLRMTGAVPSFHEVAHRHAERRLGEVSLHLLPDAPLAVDQEGGGEGTHPAESCTTWPVDTATGKVMSRSARNLRTTPSPPAGARSRRGRGSRSAWLPGCGVGDRGVGARRARGFVTLPSGAVSTASFQTSRCFSGSSAASGRI